MEIEDIEVCDDWMEKVENRVLVSDMIDSCALRDRDVKVLKMRYWDDMTLAAIGNNLKLSKERVRQILGRSMRTIMRSPFVRLIKREELIPPICPDYFSVIKEFIERERATHYGEVI